MNVDEFMMNFGGTLRKTNYINQRWSSRRSRGKVASNVRMWLIECVWDRGIGNKYSSLSKMVVSWWFNGIYWDLMGIYPLVNLQKTMENVPLQFFKQKHIPSDYKTLENNLFIAG